MNPHFPIRLLYVILYIILYIASNESLFLNKKKPSISAILACGGNGQRYIESGGKGIKQFNCVNNIPIYLFSLYELLKYPQIKHIVLVTHKNKFNDIIYNLRKLSLLSGIKDSTNNDNKLLDCNYFYYYNNKLIFKSDSRWNEIECLYKSQKCPYRVVKVTLCESGSSRKLTVINGLRCVEESDLILIHDSVRPLICNIDLDNMIKIANNKGSSVPFIRVNDSIKEHSNYNYIKSGDVDRDGLVLIQTPQIYRANLIKKAYKSAENDDKEYFDSSSYVEKYCNERVYLVPGHVHNMKITTLSEFDMIRHLLIEKYFI